MAFAFQLLLTNLGIALGLSVIGWEPTAIANGSEPDRSPGNSGSSETSGGLPVTHLLGFGVALSLSSVLFVAALLAVEFSQITQARLGGIFGIMLWATYLLLITWLGSTTVSSLVNSALGTAATGIRQLFAALRQTVSPPQPAASHANQETQANQEMLRAIAAELSQIPTLHQQLPQLLTEQRELLLAEILEQTDLSNGDAETVLENLQPASSKAAVSAISSSSSSPSWQTRVSSSASSLLSDLPELPDWRSLLRQALGRLDLADWDIETLWHALQDLRQNEADSPFNIVPLDVEDYLQQVPDWSLRPALLQAEFAELLHDPEADPRQVLTQLQGLRHTDFVNWLEQRRDLTAAKVAEIADQLSDIHSTVLKTVQAQVAATQPQWLETLTQQLSQLPLAQLSPTDLASWLQDFIDHQQISPPQIESLLSQLDGEALSAVFGPHPDLPQTQQEAIVTTLKNSRDRILSQIQKQQSGATAAIAALQSKLVAYFRYTSLDKLSAAAVAEKLRSQLEESQLLSADGVLSILADLDLTEIEQTIARRQGMTPERQARLAEALRSGWQSYLPQADSIVLPQADSIVLPQADSIVLPQADSIVLPQADSIVLPQADSIAEELYQNLEAYLQAIDWSNVTLEEIKSQVMQLLAEAQTSGQAFDVKRLLSRLSLPEAVQTQLERSLRQARHKALKLPRRWAKRAGQVATSASDRLTTKLSNYLRYQDRSALNPEQITQDLSQIVKATVQSLPEALSSLPLLEPSFWQQALAERRDLTQAEMQSVLAELTSVWQTLTQQASTWATELKPNALVESLSRFTGDIADNISGQISGQITGSDGAESNPLDTVRQQVVARLSAAQQQLQAQTQAVQQELQAQTDAARRQIAIAAWWLFIGLFSSGLAAAGAGWLAVLY
ncbi:MAG: hypothetical protein HC816_00145 [Leptolyngbyaceae cyanobacterium RM1_1_2]|nr:hypothetical protein [Leptolyngbyaceae cyanobacterium RM1_1_2]